jgi:hypothetical protein
MAAQISPVPPWMVDELSCLMAVRATHLNRCCGAPMQRSMAFNPIGSPDRARRLLTVIACQRPPRAVAIPRAFNAPQ